jgi:predicted DNA binding CopG/RHH family protein
MKKSKSKRKVFDVKLDAYEKEISDAIDQALEKGSLKRADHAAKELAFAKDAAANFLRKDARVTLRLSSGDLARLKQKAAYKGLPYQTFIASVLHEYAAGHFMEVA